MTTPLTTTATTKVQLFHLLPKIGSSDSLNIVHRVSAQNPKIFVKICRLVSENFFETKTIFPAPPPFTGRPDAKILFLSTQRPPLHKKNFEPRTSHFGDVGSKVQLSHLLHKNWVGRSPPYFAQDSLGMTAPNPENFVKIS